MTTQQPTATDTAADAAAAAQPPPTPMSGNTVFAGFVLAHADDPPTLGALLTVYAAACIAMEHLNGASPAERQRLLDAAEA